LSKETCFIHLIDATIEVNSERFGYGSPIGYCPRR
jgi:hypothetical protein